MGKRSREKRERQQGDQEIENLGQESNSFLEKVIFIGTCLILFTPFIISGKYFFPFVGVKSIYFTALVEIIFAAWLILMITNARYRPRLNALLVAVGLYLAVQTISSVLGIDFIRSFWSKYERMTGLLMQIHLFAFFLVCSSVFRKKEDWLKIFGVSVFSAILMSFLSLFPKISNAFMGQMASAARGGATIGNSSFLGTYLLFNLFFSLYLFLNSKNWFKILSAFGLIIIGIALVLSTARAALLATIGGLVLFVLLWLLLNSSRKKKVLGIIFSAVLVLSVVASVFLAQKPGNFINKTVFENVGTTFGGRLPVWQGGWKGFLERPLFGWGPENFEIVFTRHFNSCFLGPNCGGDIWYDRAHNIVIDTLVGTGILGFLSYLGIFGTVFYILWRKFSKQSVTFWAAGIFSVILVAYFVQNMTVFDMVNSYMLFFLVLGFVGGIASEREETSEKNKPVRFLTIFLVIILMAYPFIKFVLQPERADRYIIYALEYPMGSEQRLDFYKKTLETSSLGIYQIRDFFAQSTLEGVQSQTASDLRTDGVKKELDFVIQEMEKTVAESPLDFRCYLKLGQLYNAYAVLVDPQKLKEAEESLQKAIEVSPTNQQGYWSLAQTKIYMGQMQDALSLAEQALILEPKSRQSNLIVIQVAKIMGDDDLARQKAEEALKIDPSLESDIKVILGG